MYVAAEGFYHNAIGVFKVVTNQGSGRRYAKQLTKHDDGSHSWEFAKGAVTRLQPQTRLTQIKQARNIGGISQIHFLGQCNLAGGLNGLHQPVGVLLLLGLIKGIAADADGFGLL